MWVPLKIEASTRTWPGHLLGKCLRKPEWEGKENKCRGSWKMQNQANYLLWAKWGFILLGTLGRNIQNAHQNCPSIGWAAGITIDHPPSFHLPFVGSCHWEYYLPHISGKYLNVRWVDSSGCGDADSVHQTVPLTVLKADGLKQQDLGHKKYLPQLILEQIRNWESSLYLKKSGRENSPFGPFSPKRNQKCWVKTWLSAIYSLQQPASWDFKKGILQPWTLKVQAYLGDLSGPGWILRVLLPWTEEGKIASLALTLG